MHEIKQVKAKEAIKHVKTRQAMKHVKTKQAIKYVKARQAIKQGNRHKASKNAKSKQARKPKRKPESTISSGVTTFCNLIPAPRRRIDRHQAKRGRVSWIMAKEENKDKTKQSRHLVYYQKDEENRRKYRKHANECNAMQKR